MTTTELPAAESGDLIRAQHIQTASLRTVDEAWNAVMNDVQGIAKNQRASMPGAGSFNFRGIDAVVDAVGPALRKHGVTVLPKKIKKVEREEYSTSKGTRMVNKQVTIVWQVRGPQGDTFTGESVGEAADAGDKSISKAASVAYRVFLLQALCIPTGERDPDYEVHERASEPSPEERAAVENANEERLVLLELTKQFGWTEDLLVKEYWEREGFRKNLRNTTDVAKIREFMDVLIKEGQEGKSPVAEAWSGDPGSEARAALERQVVAAAQQADARITKAQSRQLHVLFKINKMPDRDEYLQWCSDALGFKVETTDDLTATEASKLIDKQKQLENQEKPQKEAVSDDNGES